MKKWILVFLLTAACQSKLKVDEYITPEGKQGYITTCENNTDCWVAVSKRCPLGYSVLRNDSIWERGGWGDYQLSHLTVSDCKTQLVLPEQEIHPCPSEASSAK